jgi:hypothetical protein
MAKSTLDIIVNVVDAASKKLSDVNKQLRGTGDAAKKTGMDMVQFNRIMFSTTAFVGILQKQLSVLNSTLDKGAELGRIQDQFEAVLGPKGALFDAIDGMTKASIDRVEAMKSGIALKTLGIANSVQDAATIITGAGVAAKRAGIESGEGIRRVTQALKDGNLSNLEFLNLIRTNDVGLKAYLAVLNKYSGVMAGAVTAQQKNALIMRIITQVAKSAKDEHADLADVLFNLKQSFTFLRSEIGQYLGEALKPTLEATTKLFNNLSDLFSQFKKSKELVFVAKAFITATTAVVGFYSAIFVAKNAISMLGSLGFGVPKLIAILVGLGMTFQGVTNKADTLIEKFRVFGAFLKGIYELVANFDPESGMSKISEATADMLEKNGILALVENISRATIVVKTFATTVVDYITRAAKTLDTAVGGITNKIFSFFGATNKPWARSWIDNTSKVYKSLAGIAAVLIGIVGVSKVLGIGKGLLSKIPVVGRFFGGGSQGPSGSASDPIYVKMLDNLSGWLKSMIPTTGGVGAGTETVISTGAQGALGAFKDKILQTLTPIAMFIGKLGLLAAVISGVYYIGDWLGKKFQKLMGMNPDSALGQAANERSGFGPFSMPTYGADELSVANQLDKQAAAMGIKIPSIDVNKLLGESENYLQVGEGNRAENFAKEALGEIADKRFALGTDIATGQNVTHVPENPQDAIAQNALLSATMGQVNEQDRFELEQAMREAHKGTSAGGEAITPEEWRSIFMAAINNSSLAEEMAKTAKNTADANKKTDKNTISTRRGC